jgi:hypothetical protein
MRQSADRKNPMRMEKRPLYKLGISDEDVSRFSAQNRNALMLTESIHPMGRRRAFQIKRLWVGCLSFP